MKVSKLHLNSAMILISLFKAVVSVPKTYENDGVKYVVETEYSFNWFQANRECTRRNSQLVNINTPEKNQFIVDLIKKNYGKSYNLWIGANDGGNKESRILRNFYWTTGQKIEFKYFAPLNPDNTQVLEHCAHIWEKSDELKWNDNECDNKYIGFICESNPVDEDCKSLIKQVHTELTCDADDDDDE